MARLCKCKTCGISVPKDKIIIYIDETKKTPKEMKFCSINCKNKYIEILENKQKENKAHEELCEFIMKLHNKSYLPNYFYILLSDLRNGTIRQKGIIVNKTKNGVSWEDILNGYKYSEKNILHILDIKKDFSGFINELKYCLAIVKNNIPKAKLYYQRINKDKELIDDNNINKNNKEYIYKKKIDKGDISDLLD